MLESIGDKLKKDPWGEEDQGGAEVYKDWAPQDDVAEQREQAEADGEEYDEDYDMEDDDDEDY